MCPGICSHLDLLYVTLAPPPRGSPGRQALCRQALLWVCSCPNPCEGKKSKTEVGKGLLSVWVGMTCCVDTLRLPAAFVSKSLWSRNHCLQFTDEEMETQGGSVTHPKSQNQFHDGARRVPWLLAQCFPSAVPWLLWEVSKPWSLCSFQAPQPWLPPWAPFLYLCFCGCPPHLWCRVVPRVFCLLILWMGRVLLHWAHIFPIVKGLKVLKASFFRTRNFNLRFYEQRDQSS